MLEGLEVEDNPEMMGFPHLEVETVYEDDAIVVVNKPSGMLSMPGRIRHHRSPIGYGHLWLADSG